MNEIKEILKKHKMRVKQLRNIEKIKTYNASSNRWDKFFNDNIQEKCYFADSSKDKSKEFFDMITELFVTNDYGFHSTYPAQLEERQLHQTSNNLSPILDGFISAYIFNYGGIDDKDIIDKYKVQISTNLWLNLSIYDMLEDEFFDENENLMDWTMAIRWIRLTQSGSGNLMTVEQMRLLSYHFSRIFIMETESDYKKKGTFDDLYWFIESGYKGVNKDFIKKIFNDETSLTKGGQEETQLFLSKLYVEQDIYKVTDMNSSWSYIQCKPILDLLDVLNSLDDGIKLQMEMF